MKGLLALLPLLILASLYLFTPIKVDAKTDFNVLSYGAIGDGVTDDSQAFLRAWKDVCGATEIPTLFIPNGKTFLLHPILFQGPCNAARVNIMHQAKIIAPQHVGAWNLLTTDKNVWIGFSGVEGLIIQGNGRFDGQGASWWNCSSCPRPTAISFNSCQNLHLHFLTHIDSPKNHISITSCNGVQISHLNIIAPGDSPNTDGIDISKSSNVVISDSTIKTGDDCIAINGGSSFINITGVQCGPGHGISVGSLGIDGGLDTVEEVHVINCTFIQSQNGARIKTWEGGSGYARNITFEGIILNAAQNPVIIDQHYKDDFDGNAEKAVKVSDVTFSNIQGTSASQIAININCDENIPCTDIIMDYINITSSTPGMQTKASCINANVMSSSTYPNVICHKKLV